MARIRGGRGQVKIQVKGLKRLLHNLKELPKRVARKVLRDALFKATDPVYKDMRAGAKTGQDTGALYKSIGRRAKTYAKSGSAVVVVGPRTKQKKIRKGGKVVGVKLAGWARGLKGLPAVPTKYAHLVEFGTARHAQPRLGIIHPGSRPRAFVRPAWDKNKKRMEAIAKKLLWDGIQREAKKLHRGKSSA